ncbi:30S ribosomal protein S5 protein [Thalictrum thalictroides]|uniref:Small ribosomal subunit protein uS5c n=1 Tax=Thalictrum thalictroides TaxID=46969 RepID=A0A7J6VJX8_THATH|nr:30S ribosomal protein S5 protein [Thalictrum thalictroides]
MAASATTLSSFSSLSIRSSSSSTFFKSTPISIPISQTTNSLFTTSSFSFSSKTHLPKPFIVNSEDGETIFFDEVNPEEEIVFDPPVPPEGYVPPPAFDEGPAETEDEIASAYEELYGPAYSGVSVLGNDVFVMDAKMKKATGFGTKTKKEKVRDGFDERVVQVRRVTKVVKGGKQLHFRAVVVVGDKQGNVGVGVGKAKEVIAAVQKSAVNARRNIITVPMTKYATFPHRADGDYGAAKVMLRPASPGTGVIAGGSVRIVLEMAGVENALGKQLGSNNALNNARATVVAVQKMRQFSDVARERGIPMEELWK